MLKVTRAQLQRYGMAAFSSAAAWILPLVLLKSAILAQPLFFVAVTLSTWYGGFGPGLLTSVMAVFAVNYWFVPPVYSLAVKNWQDILQLVAFACAAILTSAIVAIARAAQIRTEAKLSKLQLSEEWYRRIVDTAHEGIWLVNAELRTEYVNQRMADMLGYEPEEILNRSIFEFMDVQGRQEAEQRLSRRRRAIKQQFEFRYRRQDGSQLWAIVAVTQILNEKREFIGAIATVADITSRKQAEEKLWESNQTLESLIQACPLAIAAFSLDDGRVSVWNPAAEKIFGWSKQQATARFLPETTRDEPDDSIASLQAVRQGKALAGVEVRRRKPDGTQLDLAVWTCDLRDAKGAANCMAIVADMSAKKRLEEELRSALTKLTFHVENSPLAAIEWDRDYRISQWSKQAEKIFGWQAVEVLGKRLFDWEFVFAGDRETTRSSMEGLIDGREQRNVSFNRNYTKNGEVVYCEWYNSALFDESGKMLSVLSLVRDVTERQQMEEALRKSEERYRALVAAISSVVWTTNAGGKYVTPQPSWEAYTGQSWDRYSERGWIEAIHPDDRESVLRLWEEAIASKTKYESKGRIWHAASGQYRYFVDRGIPLFSPDGAVREWVGTLTDIDEPKRAKNALQESEQRLRIALETGKLGSWQLDWATGTLECSDTCKANFGLPPDAELSGDRVVKMIHPDDYPEARAALDRAVKQQTDGDAEFRAIWPDGSVRWLVARFRALYKNEKIPMRVVGVTLDVTDRKRSEERSRFLAEASSVLAASLDCQTTLANLATLLVPALADCCYFDVTADGKTLERVAWKHAAPASREWFDQVQRFIPQETFKNHPIRDVLLSGKTILIGEVSEEWMQAVATSAEHLQFMREMQLRSVMVVPLQARDRTLGALTFLLTAFSGRHYTSDDMNLAEDIAHRAALAIDNAMLYQEATAARERAEEAKARTERLQAITAALSEALATARVAEVVVNQGIAAMGAVAGSVMLLDESGGFLKMLATVGYPQKVLDASKEYAASAAVPLADSLRSRQPMFFECLDALLGPYPHLADLPAITGNRAFACIPLTVEGRAIGAMSLSFQQEREFSEEDRAFMLSLGQQCAQAIARARLYEAEQRARADAESANRLKDEFLAIVSHEVRSPLNPILGWAKLLRTRKFDEAGTHRALEIIERNAKLQAQLIDDLLDVSRILRGKLSLTFYPVNLVPAIEAAIETVRLAADAKSIQIQTVFASKSVQVFGDPNRLQQVVWNLLSNAVKFTPEGGRVEVRLSVEMENGASGEKFPPPPLSPSPPLPLPPSPPLPIPYVQIQVIDTGKGINPEFLPHVFDYFRQENSTTTRKFGGLGLGLAIVRHLVELHGGTVGAESLGDEKGATFTVKLPLEKPSAGSRGFQLKDTLAPHLGAGTGEAGAPLLQTFSGLRVLVVDDDTDTRELIAFTLEQYGAEVRSVASSAQALSCIASWLPDLLLSDIGMPEMDGYMLLRQIRTLTPEQGGNLAAIALTAYAGESDRQQILNAGFLQHLTKPIEPAELAAAISSTIGRSANT